MQQYCVNYKEYMSNGFWSFKRQEIITAKGKNSHNTVRENFYKSTQKEGRKIEVLSVEFC